MFKTISNTEEPSVQADVFPNRPKAIIRYILKRSRKLGSISFSYHLAPSLRSRNTELERTFFTDRKTLSQKFLDPAVEKLVERAHERVIASGNPSTYLSLLALYRDNESAQAKDVRDRIKKQGIIDSYIIPVYGPFKIEGSMSFGFDKPVDLSDELILPKLQEMAVVGHTRIVADYAHKVSVVKLSKRERQVLIWIGQGKTNYEIAIITDLKASTVDSYTRRIYGKLGVHSKIDAVLAAIASNTIKL